MLEASPAFILMSRLLVGAIALLLLVIPWSERYSALDSFPHGHDVELSVLAFFVMLGLVLLFVRSGRNRVRSILTVKHWLLSVIPPAISLIPERRHVRPLTDPHHPPLAGSTLDRCNLPLQI